MNILDVLISLGSRKWLTNKNMVWGQQRSISLLLLDIHILPHWQAHNVPVLHEQKVFFKCFVRSSGTVWRVPGEGRCFFVTCHGRTEALQSSKLLVNAAHSSPGFITRRWFIHTPLRISSNISNIVICAVTPLWSCDSCCVELLLRGCAKTGPGRDNVKVPTGQRQHCDWSILY